MWILLGILALGIAYLALRNATPKDDDVTAGDVKRPKAEEGVPFIRVYGTGWLDDPQVHWTGDLLVTEIYKSGGKK